MISDSSGHGDHKRNPEPWSPALNFPNVRRITTPDPKDTWLQAVQGSLVTKSIKAALTTQGGKRRKQGQRVTFHSIYFRFPAAFAVARETRAPTPTLQPSGATESHAMAKRKAVHSPGLHRAEC